MKILLGQCREGIKWTQISISLCLISCVVSLSSDAPGAASAEENTMTPDLLTSINSIHLNSTNNIAISNLSQSTEPSAFPYLSVTSKPQKVSLSFSKTDIFGLKTSTKKPTRTAQTSAPFPLNLSTLMQNSNAKDVTTKHISLSTYENDLRSTTILPRTVSKKFTSAAITTKPIFTNGSDSTFSDFFEGSDSTTTFPNFLMKNPSFLSDQQSVVNSSGVATDQTQLFHRMPVNNATSSPGGTIEPELLTSAWTEGMYTTSPSQRLPGSTMIPYELFCNQMTIHINSSVLLICTNRPLSSFHQRLQEINVTVNMAHDNKVFRFPLQSVNDDGVCEAIGVIPGETYLLDLEFIFSGGLTSFECARTTHIADLVIPKIQPLSSSSETGVTLSWQFTSEVYLDSVEISYINKDTGVSSPPQILRRETFGAEPYLKNGLAVISGLQPGMLYAFEISGRLNLGDLISLSGQFDVITTPAKPRNVESRFVGLTAVELTWQQENHELIEQYEITYTGSDNVQMSKIESNNYTTLEPLTVNMDYTVQIVAIRGSQRSAVLEYIFLGRSPKINIEIKSFTETSIKLALMSYMDVDFVEIYLESEYRRFATLVLEEEITYNYTLTSLTPGKLYTILLNASVDTYSWRESVEHATVPSPPRSLNLSTPTDSSLEITWHPPPQNTQFDEYVITIEGRYTGSRDIRKPKQTPIVRLDNIQHGDFYSVTCQTISHNIKSKAIVGTKISIPGPPIVLKTTSTETTIKLVLHRPVGFFQFVKAMCRRCSPEGNDLVRMIAFQNQTEEVHFTGLMSNMQFVVDLITVQKIDVQNEQSKKISHNVFTYPYAPTSVGIITPVNTTNLHIKWLPPDCNNCQPVKEYNITITAISPGNWPTVSSKGTPCERTIGHEGYCTLNITGLLPGVQYNISIQSQNIVLSSKESAQIAARTKPATPEDLTIRKNDTALELSWSKSHGFVEEYHVQLRTLDEEMTGDEDFLHHVYTDLDPGVTYHVRLYSKAGIYFSVASVYNVTTLSQVPGPVSNVRVVAVSPTMAHISFQHPLNFKGRITGYQIIYEGYREWNELCSQDTIKRQGSISAATFVSVANLKGGCEYHIQIQAQTSAGFGEIVKRTITTTIGVPMATGQVPDHPVPDSLTYHQFEVKFDPSLFDDTNGPIEKFTIIVAEDESHYQPSGGNLSLYKMLNWANAIDQSPIPPYQIADPMLVYLTPNHNLRARRSVTFPQTITVGKEDCSKNSDDFCNGALKDGKAYVYWFRGFTAEGYRDTPASRRITLNKDQSAVVVTILTILIFLFFIVIVLIVMLLRRKLRIDGKGDYALAPHIDGSLPRNQQRGSSRIKYSRPVRLQEFCQDFHTNSAHSNYGYSQEFESLKKAGRKFTYGAAVLPQNVGKNRYTNILPYDKTRVKVSSVDDEEGTDYINANYITGHNFPREFIACQGPMPDTADDMWRMVWEQNVSVIVMVTQLVEKGKVKCDQYWPDDHKPVMYGDLQITLTQCIEQEHWNMRELSLYKFTQDQRKKVKHFNYLSWPDHGVPESSDALLQFIEVVRKQTPRNGTSTVVHCSAGCGRTGTYICLDRILQQIEEFDVVDVLGIVGEMRHQRQFMVQTEQQYVFIHRCVLDILEDQGIAPKRSSIPMNGDSGILIMEATV